MFTMLSTCLAAAVVAAPPQYPAAVQALGPSLWYRFSELSGNVVNQGSLGAGFNALCSAAVVRGVATTAGGDAACSFTTTDAFLESLSASPLTGNPSFTAEAIVRLTPAGTAALWGPFLHWGQGGTGREVYFSVASAFNDRVYAGFYNAGQRSAGPVPTGRWIHVVWARQGGTDTAAGTTVYINGSPIATIQDPQLSPGFLAASGIDVTSTVFRVNRASDFIGGRSFTGDIDELALYSRVLSAQEIAGLARAAGVVCYPNCDNSTVPPVLNAGDFSCFLSRFRDASALTPAQQVGSYANCDGSTVAPVLNAGDFACFLSSLRAGCP